MLVHLHLQLPSNLGATASATSGQPRSQPWRNQPANWAQRACNRKSKSKLQVKTRKSTTKTGLPPTVPVLPWWWRPHPPNDIKEGWWGLHQMEAGWWVEGQRQKPRKRKELK